MTVYQDQSCTTIFSSNKVNTTTSCQESEPDTFLGSKALFCTKDISRYPINFSATVNEFFSSDDTCTGEVYQFTALINNYCLKPASQTQWHYSSTQCSSTQTSMDFYFDSKFCQGEPNATDYRTHTCYSNDGYQYSDYVKDVRALTEISAPKKSLRTAQKINLQEYPDLTGATKIHTCESFQDANTNFAMDRYIPCTFTTEANSEIYIVPENFSCVQDTYIRLYDSSNNQIAFNDDLSSEDSSCAGIIFLSDKGGNYTIHQGCYNMEACAGTYEVYSRPTTLTPTEENFSFQIGANVEFSTKITACPGDNININGCDCTGVPNLELFDPEEVSLGVGNSNCGTCPTLSALASVTNECVIYTLKISCGDQDCSSNLIIDVSPEMSTFDDDNGSVAPFSGFSKTACYVNPDSNTSQNLMANQVINGISLSEYQSSQDANMDVIQEAIISTFGSSIFESQFDDFKVTSSDSNSNLKLLETDSINVYFSLNYNSYRTTDQVKKIYSTAILNNVFDNYLHSIAQNNPNSSPALITATSSQVTYVTPKSNNDLSEGEIAGIILGIVFGFVIIGLLIYFFFAKSEVKNVALSTQETDVNDDHNTI